MPIFRKKPVEVEARLLASYHDAERIVIWIESCGGKATYGQEDDGPVEVLISTPEGLKRANMGDWVVQDTNGDFYPHGYYAFQEEYERVVSDIRKNAPALSTLDGKCASCGR